MSTTQYGKLPPVTDEDRGWRMMVEMFGYNPKCPWCNHGYEYLGIGSMWGVSGILFLHPNHAMMMGAPIWGNWSSSTRMCVSCANRYDLITESLKEEYDFLYPDGPPPLLTVDRTDERQTQILVKYFHARVIEHVVSIHGPAALVQLAKQAQAEIDALPKYLPPAGPQRLEDSR